MRKYVIGLVGASALALAAPASAAPAHCFDSFGAPVGPTYDGAAPDQAWISWIYQRGGSCRELRADEVALYEARRLDYPREFRPNTAPPRSDADGDPPVRHSQPPADVTWTGDPSYAARLVSFAYAERGKPEGRVVDTGRMVMAADGGWRVYRIEWENGDHVFVAVARRPDNAYMAMESRDGMGNWSTSVMLGR